MKRIVIEGKKPLKGSVSISGAKNSAVAILPAALLCDGIVNIGNVPNITDKDALFDIIKLLRLTRSRYSRAMMVVSGEFILAWNYCCYTFRLSG